jgi:integrase
MSEHKIYNEEQKERYLDFLTDNEGTKNTIRSIFYKSWALEDARDRDLADFNLEEIGKVIERSNPFSKSVAKTTTRFLSSYITFAIENGLRENNINPLDGVSNEWIESFVDMTKKIHYSYSEFVDLIEKMNNGQDQAFLYMVYEGIIGERFSELIELKLSDINWETNEVYIKSRDENITVSDECMKYIKKAYDEDVYHQYNKKTNQYTIKSLLKSEYIFKNVESPRAIENEPVKLNVIYKRLHSLKEIFNLEYLNPQSIRQSGMIYAAYQIYQEEGILGYDQLAKIGKRFDYSTITNQSTGEPYYNTFLMKNFITKENLKDLYNIDAEIKIR